MPMAGSGSFELTVSVILLLLVAFFGLGPAIQALYPGRRELIEKAIPAAGIIGIVGFLWGAWMVIRTLIGIGMLGDAPLIWLVLMIGALDLVALGFLLGYGLVAKQIQGKNQAMAERGSKLQQRIGGFQFPLGLVALFVSGFLIGLNAIFGAIMSIVPSGFPTTP